MREAHTSCVPWLQVYFGVALNTAIRRGNFERSYLELIPRVSMVIFPYFKPTPGVLLAVEYRTHSVRESQTHRCSAKLRTRQSKPTDQHEWSLDLPIWRYVGELTNNGRGLQMSCLQQESLERRLFAVVCQRNCNVIRQQWDRPVLLLREQF